jgi:uncharacterized protein (TIGR02246 family)
MTDAQAEHEREIRRLIAEYCHHYDDRRPDAFAQLFTEDAHLVVSGRDITGRDAIRDQIGTQAPDQAPGQHVTYNSVIEVAPDGARASARTDFCYLRRDRDSLVISTAGRYLDELVHDDRWRFARRTIVFLGDPAP